MKIDIQKFPAMFDNDIVIKQFKHLIAPEMVSQYYEIMELARANTFYVAGTILDHVSNSFSKLVHLKNELPEIIRGVLFVTDQPDSEQKVTGPTSLFYMISHHKDPDRIMITGQISVVADGKAFGQMVAGYIRKDEEKLLFHSYEAIPGIDVVTHEVIQHIIAIELFLNFAEIEKKVVQPNRQIWDGPVAKYNNKTKLPITIVDSTWYTHLISSGAFKVRGHFRLQPHGPDRSKRKLVWINDFEKDGYTRKAKIES